MPVGRLEQVAAGLFLAFALLVLAVTVADDAGRPLGGRLLAGVTLAALYAAPAVLALLARRDRPALLLAAGLLGLALVPTSMSVTPLLVGPSVLLLVAHGRSPARLPVLPTVALTVGLGWAAFLAGFLTDDPVCWNTATGGGCASDSTSPLEAGTRLALTAALIGVAYRAAGPTPTRSSPVAST